MQYNTEIINKLTMIYELRGKTNVYETDYKDTLDKLTEIAKVQSTTSSNRIEGIYTTNSRLNAIMAEKTAPKTRDEKEITGYRDVLNLIHESYDYIPINRNTILELHKRLFAYTGNYWGGTFKDSDNRIITQYADGREEVRFEPPAAFITPALINDLCDNYNRAIAKGGISPLILSAAFIFDFVSIHPFNDGNGRMSRLLMLLTMYKNGFDVGKYVSIEKAIEDTKDSYYQALKESSVAWHTNANDYYPFVDYFLGIVLKTYREFNDRLRLVNHTDLPVNALVIKVLRQALHPLSIKELNASLPQYSEITIRRAVTALREQGKVVKLGQGRSTKYGLIQD